MKATVFHGSCPPETAATAQTWLIDMSPEKCADLLERATLGRLAVIVEGKPEIFPVNHVYDRHAKTVAFPTRPGTKLKGILNWPSVAFEVDGIDTDGGGGWSVAVVGAPVEVIDAAEVARLAALRHIPWAAGRAVRWIRIVSSKTTGRQISAVETACTDGHRTAPGWDLGPYSQAGTEHSISGSQQGDPK